jgi:hypothetical protein
MNPQKLQNGINSVLQTFKAPAKCVGDIYKQSDKNVFTVIFCFDDEKILESFYKMLANKINSADFQKTFRNITETEEFELWFSDGHDGLEVHKVKSTPEGLVKASSDNEYVVFYRALEDLGGKKCNILHNLPIVPINFLDKEIFTPQCVLKIKYNKLDTYIGSAVSDCGSIISDIKNKMTNKCNEVLNDNKVSQANTPSKGIWTGWVYLLKKTQNKPEIALQEKALLKINPKSIDIENDGKIDSLKFPFLKWNCNNDGSCSLQEFFSAYEKTSKEKDFGTFDEIEKKILESWKGKIPDSKSCLVLEFYEDINVICARDYAEEQNMKLALSVAIDMNLVDKSIDSFQVSEDDQLNVLFATETDKKFKEFSISIDKEGVKDDQGLMIIDYSKVQPIENTVCGAEFRIISLPLFFSEVNPYCCTRIQTDQNNFICTQQQSKCYIQLRQMILKFRKACLATKGVEISKTENKGNLNIIFAEIDNYKNRGEINPYPGTLVLGKDTVSFTKSNGEETFKFKYETLALLCEKTNQPCTIKGFTENQDPFMNPESDKVWFQSAIRNFFSKNPNIKEDDCMIVTSFDTQYNIFTIVLGCTSNQDQGEIMRNSIADFYRDRVKSFSDESPEINNFPAALKNGEYDVKMIIKDPNNPVDDSEPSTSIIKVVVDGIIMKNSGDYLFKFEQVVNYNKQKINLKYKVTKAEINADKYKLNESCCISTQTQSNTFIICLEGEKRCNYNKAIIYRMIKKKAEKKLKFDIARKIRLDQLYSQSEDPFDFGLNPNYKTVTELNKLTMDTLDISRNGIWHGWVFYAPLTKRNYQNKIKPVWMEIEDGVISFKTEFENQFPFFYLNLHEYEQLCDGHCLPFEYIEKKFKSNDDYEDAVFLKKSINNVIGQLLVPFDEKPCTILDFINPVWGHGHSHIICAVDILQGYQIRETINISYYEYLLNVDMDSQIKMPYIENDKYNGVLIQNGEINSKYNQFYIENEGLVAISVNEENGEVQADQEKMKILYKDISSDNFGSDCAFWYKNLRIKERGDNFNNVVKDNNCCFRFFSGIEKKKTEICTFSKNGGFCIKESRQLMKGIRTNCLDYVRNQAKIGSQNDEVETMIDIYTEKTVDDSENGNFEGFVYFGSAIKPSQALRQVPFFIKIKKSEINIYVDYTNLKKPDISMLTEKLIFSCKDSAPCKPSSYRTFLLGSTKNSLLIDSLRTTYGLFKDTYSLNDETFDKNCFILEDQKTPFLMCSVNDKLISSIKKAITQAYSLNYSCKQITASAEIDPNMKYSVKIFRDGNVISDTVEVNNKGVNLVSKNQILFDYNKIDNDSVTGAKCAVWFKELPITVDFPKPQCCFAVSAKQMIYTFCVEDGEMCIGSAFKLLKSIWNNCMGQGGNFYVLPASPDAEILGQAKPWSPKIPFNPIKAKFDTISSNRKVKIFDETKNLIQDFSIDNYNDIAFLEAKTLYRGWFKVYPLNNASLNSSFLKLYGELTAENFIFYPSDTEKTSPKISIRPDLLSMSCGFSEACKPFDFFDKAQEYGVEVQNEKYKSLLSTIEYGSDEGCTVLQKSEKEGPEFYVVCIHVRKNKSNIKALKEILNNTTGYAASRNAISSFYGGIIRKITYQAYVLSRKFLDPTKFPTYEGTFKKIKYNKDKEIVEVQDVSIDKVGALAKGEYILKYSDFKNCNIKVNVIFSPKEVLYKDKQQCCLRYKSQTNRQYLCLNDINCEAETLRLAHNLKTNCEKFVGKPGNIFNELNSNPVVRIMPIIKTVFQAQLSMSNPTELQPIVKQDPENTTPVKPMSTQAFNTKNKTLAIKFLYMIKKIIHQINLSQPYDSGAYDEQKDPNDKYAPEFFGKSIDGDYKLTVADDKRIYSGPDGLELTMLGDAYYIKHKEFQAAINPKVSYTVLKYKKDGVLKLLFIYDKKLLLTTHSKFAPKHTFLNGNILYNIINFLLDINNNLKETGLLLDSDDFKA